MLLYFGDRVMLDRDTRKVQWKLIDWLHAVFGPNMGCCCLKECEALNRRYGDWSTEQANASWWFWVSDQSPFSLTQPLPWEEDEGTRLFFSACLFPNNLFDKATKFSNLRWCPFHIFWGTLSSLGLMSDCLLRPTFLNCLKCELIFASHVRPELVHWMPLYFF